MDICQRISRLKKTSYSDEIKHVIDNESTVLICYPEYNEAYDYVDKMFPKLNVKDIKIYIYDRDHSIGILSKKQFYGFYNVSFDSVFVAKREEGSLISIDETIVHELFHYVSFHDNDNNLSGIYEEYFAYANSLKYFKSKGWSDDDLIRKYLFPFFSIKFSKKLAMNKAKYFLIKHMKKDTPTNKNDFLNIL